MKNDKTLYILDGYGFVFRAYYVQPKLTNPEGQQVGALYGLASMLLKLINDFKPEFFCIALDHKGPNFRHKLYPQYKANRSDIDEELKAQLPLIPDLIDSFNIKQFSKDGYEADDIIAYLADKAENSGYNVVIISSDKDSFLAFYNAFLLEEKERQEENNNEETRTLKSERKIETSGGKNKQFMKEIKKRKKLTSQRF